MDYPGQGREDYLGPVCTCLPTPPRVHHLLSGNITHVHGDGGVHWAELFSSLGKPG